MQIHGTKTQRLGPFQCYENANMIIYETVDRTLRERLFSLTPWRPTKVAKKPNPEVFKFSDGKHEYIVGHPTTMAELYKRFAECGILQEVR